MIYPPEGVFCKIWPEFEMRYKNIGGSTTPELLLSILSAVATFHKVISAVVQEVTGHISLSYSG